MNWDEHCDVLVFGSGAAGLTAALVAASEGLDVLLCEKTGLVGGTTARSAGTLWVPGAPPIDRSGHGEERAVVERYLRHELGVHHDDPAVRAFLDSAPQAVRYLEEHSAVRFQHVENPDYHSDAPGGSAFGRGIAPVPFDARELGADFAILRPPLAIHMVLGGMMVGRREVPLLLQPFKSMFALKTAATIVAGHLRARLTHPRGTRLLLGNALVARLLYSLRKAGARIRLQTGLVDLVRDGGRVRGAVVRHAAGDSRVEARRAVVLATGGMAHDHDARKTLMSAFPHRHSLACEANAGEGIQAARRIGAALNAQVASPAFWSPASVLRAPDGGETLWLHGHMDRGKPGLLAVDARGHRFVNESDSYHDFVMAQFGTVGRGPAHVPAYLVCDHRFIRRYGLGMVVPIYGRLDRYVKAGYLHRAESIGALASQIGAEPDVLQATVAAYDRDARQGLDAAFGRGQSAFNRFNGDPEIQPNPCMHPLDQPPFYAVKVEPCSIGHALGLATDTDSRVQDESGCAIEGLYACGNDMTSVMRGLYPGPGIMLGPAVTFGYRAAMAIAGGN